MTFSIKLTGGITRESLVAAAQSAPRQSVSNTVKEVIRIEQVAAVAKPRPAWVRLLGRLRFYRSADIPLNKVERSVRKQRTATCLACSHHRIDKLLDMPYCGIAGCACAGDGLWHITLAARCREEKWSS